MELYCVEYTMLKKSCKRMKSYIVSWLTLMTRLFFSLNSWTTSILNVLVHNTTQHTQKCTWQCRCVSCSVCVHKVWARPPPASVHQDQVMVRLLWWWWDLLPTLLSVRLHLLVGLRRCSHGVVSAFSQLGSWVLLSSPEFSRVWGQEVMYFLESSDDGDGFEAGVNGLKWLGHRPRFLLPSSSWSFLRRRLLFKHRPSSSSQSIPQVSPSAQHTVCGSRTHLVRLVGCWKPAVDWSTSTLGTVKVQQQTNTHSHSHSHLHSHTLTLTHRK